MCNERGLGDDGWVNDLYLFTRIVVDSICFESPPLRGYSDLKKQHVIPIALVAGGMTRNIHELSNVRFAVSDVYRKEIYRHGIPKFRQLDSLSKRAFYGILEGPYDMDIKVVNEGGDPIELVDRIKDFMLKYFGEFSERHHKNRLVDVYDYQLICTEEQNTSSVKIESWDSNNGKRFLKVTMRQKGFPYQVFKTDITWFSSEDDLIDDYRRGRNQSDHQNLNMILGLDLREDPDREIVFLDREEEFKSDVNSWYGPESIREPEYLSLDQAVIAGINLMKNILLYPRSGDHSLEEYVDLKTITKFREKLNENIQSHLVSEESIDLYRVEEIIRGMNFLSTLDPILFTRLATALGIMDVFLPEIGSLKVDKYKDETKSHRIVSQFNIDGNSSFIFPQYYFENLPFLRFENLGSMQILRALKSLGMVQELDENILGVAKLFDPREIRQRWNKFIKQNPDILL